jgi:hypothetical protein
MNTSNPDDAMMTTTATLGETASEVATMVKPEGHTPVMDARSTDGENTKDHHANADQIMVEACTARGDAAVIANVSMEVVAVIPSGDSLVHTVIQGDLITVVRVAAMITIAEIGNPVREVDTARGVIRGTKEAVGVMKRGAGVIRVVAVSMASRWGIGRTGGVRHPVVAERVPAMDMASHVAAVPATIVTSALAGTMAATVNAHV